MNLKLSGSTVRISLASLSYGRTVAGVRDEAARGPEDAALRTRLNERGNHATPQREREREREREGGREGGRNEPDGCKMDQPVAGSPRDLRTQRRGKRERLDEIPMASGGGSTRSLNERGDAETQRGGERPKRRTKNTRPSGARDGSPSYPSPRRGGELPGRRHNGEQTLWTLSPHFSV